MDSDNKPCINPIEDQRESALKHYKQASEAIHHCSGFVEAAIKAYNPNVAIPLPKENKEQFWTDEKVLEFAKWYRFSSSRASIDQFKSENNILSGHENLPQVNATNKVEVKENKEGKEDEVIEVIKIDYDNIPLGEVCLLTTSKVWIIGDWYNGGWRTKLSQWVDGKITTLPKEDITHYFKLPSWENL